MTVAAAVKQTSFDFDMSKREPVVREYKADFTAMHRGHMAGNERRIIRCPVCSRNCLGIEQAKKWKFVHQAIIQSTAKQTTWEPTDVCTMNHQDLQTLRDLGVVTCNRLGQILEVK
jgi:hypothetical protein